MHNFPIHPALVHFPIAFYFLEFVLILLWAVKNRGDYQPFARFSFHAAYLAMWLALGTGLYTAGGPVKALEHAREHFLSALSVMTFYSLRFFFWRSPWKDSKRWHLAQVGLGIILVLMTGYFGGVLSHSEPSS